MREGKRIDAKEGSGSRKKEQSNRTTHLFDTALEEKVFSPQTESDIVPTIPFFKALLERGWSVKPTLNNFMCCTFTHLWEASVNHEKVTESNRK